MSGLRTRGKLGYLTLIGEMILPIPGCQISTYHSRRRAHEKRINAFPNWKVDVTDDDGSIYNIHFIGVLSEDANAIPLVLLHGWPGAYSAI
jgi:hypothetical protein